MNKKIILVLLLGWIISGTISAQVETFTAGDKTFLLNGKPFVIKAAELHYPRIPKEYWEHRIKLCKALGMNAVSVYVFWNIHEQEEGKFDFSGNNDVAEFCRLIQENGMYIILRPGPYVCAEWEMGGLPWWLLKKKDIKLRDNDPYFLERAEIFLNEVSKRLADFQITRGGKIIVVQVENEYGAYGINREYMTKMRDITRKVGLREVVLSQSDWNSNFEPNMLDDLVMTLNFGTGSNIEEQFRRLKELRPESPIMCGELWSGWFDHWGAKHETRSGEALISGMKEMLDQNISVGLYMAHGGTNFGHWGGANFPNFSPITTSYDYNAPISESGQATPKFFQVRNLLRNYLQEGEILAPVPDSIPTISIPSFELTAVAPLFENLPKPKYSEKIQSMEFFDQGWGSILYRTTLKKSGIQQILKITEAHDWAQVFVNGEKIGTLNRLKGENKVSLPQVKEGDILDILVEAMGRMNFGKGIYDWKGITQKVEIIDNDGNNNELKNWRIYNIPVDYKFAKSKRYKMTKPAKDVPAYYKGSFTLDKTGDTFLDMSNWKKGLVWVNGYAIGRFWEIGPQQTLYVPGCWLKKGKNEIIVLDNTSPETATVQGLRQPILDMLKGTGAFKHRKPDENLDLTGEIPVYKGSFISGHGWQQVKLEKPLKTRYFCLEALNSHDGDDYASIAELELLGEDGKSISRQHWKVVYANSEEIEDVNNAASNVFDMQESTIWHTSYSITKDSYPHHIIIDLGEDKIITGFSYLPRGDANKPGMIKDYQIYLKMDHFKLK
jgi:beta-galactosidase